jgi:hypothetical protein
MVSLGEGVSPRGLGPRERAEPTGRTRTGELNLTNVSVLSRDRSSRTGSFPLIDATNAGTGRYRLVLRCSLRPVDPDRHFGNHQAEAEIEGLLWDAHGNGEAAEIEDEPSLEPTAS